MILAAFFIMINCIDEIRTLVEQRAPIEEVYELLLTSLSVPELEELNKNPFSPPKPESLVSISASHSILVPIIARLQSDQSEELRLRLQTLIKLEISKRSTAATIHQTSAQQHEKMNTAIIFSGPARIIEAIAISHDGRTLYSADRGSTIHAWNTSTGKIIRTYHLQDIEDIKFIEFSRNGRILFVAAGETIHLLHTSTMKAKTQNDGSKIEIARPGQISFMALNAKSDTIASCHGDNLYLHRLGICNIPISTIISLVETEINASHRFQTYGIKNEAEEISIQSPFMPSEPLVIYSETLWGKVRILGNQAHHYREWSISPSKKILFSSSPKGLTHINNKQILVWKILRDDRGSVAKPLKNEAGRQVSLSAHHAYALTISSDGEFLYSAGTDKTIRKWVLRDHIPAEFFEQNH